MTTGERIKSRREELGLSVEEIALRLGKHRATIYRYESDDIENFPADVLVPLARVLDTTPAYLMGWESKAPASAPTTNVLPMPSFVSRPRLGTIACGEPILAEQNVEGYDQVPDYVKCDFTLVCKGDSMINARIYDGDIVCIKRAEKVENGQIAAVLIDGEFDTEATLKRVRFLDNGIIALWPENPTYAPLIFAGTDVERVHIIGLATHFISTVK